VAEGRVLAIDYGRTYIGLAICDELRILARPLAVWRFPRSREALVDRIAETAVKEGVAEICLGYPRNPSEDRPAPLLREVEELARLLRRKLSLPIHFVSEEYTSQVADSLRASSGRRKRQRNDDAAAAIILQRYLEGGSSAEA
jgi:putative transcription antitermination factor YqgF